MSYLVVSGLILFALMGAPLFVVIALATMLAFHSLDIEPAALFIELYRVASAPSLAAIPLFTFAGFVLANGRAPERLTRLSRAFLGGLRGGVSWAVLGASAFFTAFTGASGVTIIALGGLLYPLLLKEHYSKNFSLGLITSSGSIGLLFPPSLPLILYGIVAQVSVDHLFLAGILPGLLLVGVMGLYCRFRSPAVSRAAFSKSEALAALRDSIWEIPLPLILIVGIYSGLVTLTEAATVTVLYVLLVGTFIHKELHPIKDLPRLMLNSMTLVGSIIIILGAAMGFTSYLIDEQMPMQLLAFFKEHIESPIAFLIVLNIFLLIVGCMMDIFSAIIVVVPLIIPLALHYGVDPVHLGIIFLANLEIGYATPPVGINLFISSARFSEPVIRLYKAALPFLALQLIGLLIITYFPDLSLFLVRFATD
ncbi:MAG: TRAP transporter large permease subunit [Candidatus Nitrohelix vancouverensis]|uniref:TRAP transporter large permease subunit n=1 Tax=Candidatus Nitrohelix vancouverensis TaxID=2705534 RepID=A0A7T0C3D7_9BACT|nr:MAG: TRAP transporter large permease subunit [Candidatus Nitrohelix vancouverensis]